jgi:methionyl-tRNA formyltransferase
VQQVPPGGPRHSSVDAGARSACLRSMALRIVFLGSDSIALPLLEWLATEAREDVEIVGVFTQPDRAVGRGQQVTPNAIKLWAAARTLPVLQPDRLTETSRGELAALKPDLALVMAYGHILKDDFIGTPRYGTLNLHASLLPRFRGASPIQSAIAAGETATGVTLMRIVRALDAGPVADEERVSIERLDTAHEVEGKLAAACVPLLRRNLPRLAAEALPFHEQDHAAATYCRRLVKADGVLDFQAPAAALAARINGLYPWPGCSVEVLGQTIKLGLADVAPGPSDEHPAPREAAAQRGSRSDQVGQVSGADADGVLVTTGAGLLRLRRLQRPGGRMLAAPEFLRGHPIPSGTLLPSQPMPVLWAPHPLR